MEYWLHRITGGKNALECAQKLLKEEQLISIGWKDFSTNTFLDNVKKHGISAIDKEYNNKGWKNLSRSRWSLCRFLIKMKKDDIVIIPSSYSFSVYRIIDDDIYTNESLVTKIDHSFADLGFYRRVIPICVNIPRASYAQQGLTSRLKIRQTNVNVTDLQGEILEAINAFKKESPINLKNSIIESSYNIILEQVIKKLDDHKFEKLVEWYLESIGATLVKTPSKNSSKASEGDADKVAYFDKLELIIMVQVKKHKGQTNNWAIQQICSYKDHQNNDYEDQYTTLMWVVSSGSFGEDVIKEARDKKVRLIDGKEFAKLIMKNGIDNLPL